MQNIPPNFYRVNVRALILNDKNEFLLFRTPKGKWESPGGGLDYNESPSEGLRREINEELGLEITNISSSPEYFFTSQSTEGLWLAHIVYKAEISDFSKLKKRKDIEFGFFSKESVRRLERYKYLDDFLEIL